MLSASLNKTFLSLSSPFQLYYEQRQRDHRSLDTDSLDLSVTSLCVASMRQRADTWGFLGEPHPVAEDNSQSEAGVSATESATCEMSRQASKTESCDSDPRPDTRPPDHIMDELVAMSNAMCCHDDQRQPKCAFSSSPSLSDSSDTPRDSNVDSNGYLCDCNSDGTSCDSAPNHGQSCDHAPSQSVTRTDRVRSNSVDEMDGQSQLCDNDSNVIHENSTLPCTTISVKSPDQHVKVARANSRDVTQVSDLALGGDNPQVDCVKS